MRIVAVGATDLAFPDRVVRCPPGLGANVLVAGVTLLLRADLLELARPALWLVNRVTAQAAQASLLVHATRPEELVAARVAAGTGIDLLGRTAIRQPHVDGFRILHVLTSGTVTALAGVSPLLSEESGAVTCAHKILVSALVTGETLIAPHVGRFSLSRRRRQQQEPLMFLVEGQQIKKNWKKIMN